MVLHACSQMVLWNDSSYQLKRDNGNGGVARETGV